MREEEKINPGHTQTRSLLRVIGPLVFGLGVIFTLIGVGSFFSSFNSGPSFQFNSGSSFGSPFGSSMHSGPPSYFWCAFVGIPLMGIGGTICKFAFFGAVARYVAGEAAPVGKDTFNYMANGTRDGVRNVVSAIREGLTDSPTTSDQIRCSSCQHPNDADAQFCDQCGYRLITTRVCQHCENENDPDAKFCDNCGKSLT